MSQPSGRSQLSNRYFFSHGARASDEYHEFWIRYKPERILRHNYGSSLTALLIVSLVCAVLSISCCIKLDALQYVPVILLMLFAVNNVKLRMLTLPTHISLNDEGIRLHWLRPICNFSGRMVPWDSLTHVSIDSRPFFGMPQSILEFNLSGVAFERTWLKVEPGTSLPDVLTNQQRSVVRPIRGKYSIALGGIASSDDRKRLQIAMKKYLPSYRVDPAVSDALQLGMRVETYTDLWFESLQSSSRVRSDNLLPGDTLLGGRYEVISELAAGGQAIVYEVLDRGAHLELKSVPKECVLKEFVLPAHAGTAVRKRVLENIEREANLLKKLKHPNIVKLTDFFVEDERAYLVLERVRGLSLKKIIEDRGARAEEQVVMLGLQLCEILGYLHASNVVHRDLTPDNLILGHGDILKLIDFNVARQLENDSTKTVVGKHSYIPPEQFRGKAVLQSDLYAAGATLHFLLTGCDPEPITCSRPRDLQPTVSEEMNEIVAKATALELEQRYSSCVDLRSDLQRLKMKYSS